MQFAKFCNGDFNLKDGLRSDFNDEALKAFLTEIPFITTIRIEPILGFDHTVVSQRVNKLGRYFLKMV